MNSKIIYSIFTSNFKATASIRSLQEHYCSQNFHFIQCCFIVCVWFDFFSLHVSNCLIYKKVTFTLTQSFSFTPSVPEKQNMYTTAFCLTKVELKTDNISDISFGYQFVEKASVVDLCKNVFTVMYCPIFQVL